MQNRTVMVISVWVLFGGRNITDRCTGGKTYTAISLIFLLNSSSLWDNVEELCSAGQSTDTNITGSMRYTSWITKATHTHWEYVTLLYFNITNSYANVIQWFVISTLRVFLMRLWMNISLGATSYLFISQDLFSSISNSHWHSIRGPHLPSYSVSTDCPSGPWDCWLLCWLSATGTRFWLSKT